ncbi:uncharacterized protein LOC131656805 [Vicia villosa]|uniref:uncharacterized protein LOC131656805 n=1 Tax=Vicia villosa TaxID=3911 RepID=UPI00273C360C|nr:uncharacterized protein LOC131656805 [Vicia villosa]
MATRVTISITLLLFLSITLSRARDLQNSLSESATRSKPQQYDTVSFNLNSIDHLPVTLLDLRTINRHGHVLRPFPVGFPLSHRRCRHGHRRQIPYGNDMILANHASTKHRQISYGKDMILANDVTTKDRQIQKRLTRIHGGEGVMYPQVMGFNHPHIHSQDHHHHHHHHEKSWFSKKIHEFLNLF